MGSEHRDSSTSLGYFFYLEGTLSHPLKATSGLKGGATESEEEGLTWGCLEGASLYLGPQKAALCSVDVLTSFPALTTEGGTSCGLWVSQKPDSLQSPVLILGEEETGACLAVLDLFAWAQLTPATACPESQGLPAVLVPGPCQQAQSPSLSLRFPVTGALVSDLCVTLL